MFPSPFTHAIVRTPAPNFDQGISTAGLGQPDYQRMLQQHITYVSALQNLGLEVTVLPMLADFPDAYFVEDVAVVTPEVAVITRPGAAARLGEEKGIGQALAAHRPLAHIEAPGTVEGGDVLIAEGHCFIGLSARTNKAGAEQLGKILAEHGYQYHTIPVAAGLHLKSDVNYVGRGSLLLSAELAAHPAFAAFKQIIIDPAEAYAANTLWINGSMLLPRGFPRTHAQLAGLNQSIIELDVSEVQKMDGGLTCLSLRL